MKITEAVIDMMYIHVSKGSPMNTTIAGGDVAAPILMKSDMVSVMVFVLIAV